MDLTKLFEMQKSLREKIIKENNLEGQDLLPGLILALLVELGELANEQKSWKHWSKNKKPRTKALRAPAMMEEDKQYYNPLLDEYADGLSFVLEIGIEIAEEIQFDVREYFKEIDDDIRSENQKGKTITEQFTDVFYFANTVNWDCEYSNLFAAYYHLGEMLGFDWEQIEQAYIEKHAINMERQEVGY